MKLLTKLVLAAVLLLGCSSAAYAQKFGYINSNELIMAMPESDSMQTKMKQYQDEMTSQLEIIEVEFNNKLNDFQKNLSTYSEAVQQLKERELQDLRTRHEEFSQKLQEDGQALYQSLLTPIMNKAREAINKVGKANGFTMVFDIAPGALLYYGDNVTDILPLVKTELGINK